MSVKQMSLVWEHEFGHPEQSIMMALADHAHDDGTHIRPSVGRIAWKTGYDERTVKRHLKRLRDELKVLVLVEEGGGRGKPNVYKFDWSKGVKKSPFSPKSKRVTGGAKRVTSGIGKGDTAVSPEPSSLEPSLEPLDPPGGNAEAFQADHYVGLIDEDLRGAAVPLLPARKDRYGGEFKKLIERGIPESVLWKVVDRIVERWLDDNTHYKLTAEQALGDVQSPRGIRSSAGGASTESGNGNGSPEETIEGLRQHDYLKRYVHLAKKFDFTQLEEFEQPPWPIYVNLGGDDMERSRNLQRMQSVVRSFARRKVG